MGTHNMWPETQRKVVYLVGTRVWISPSSAPRTVRVVVQKMRTMQAILLSVLLLKKVSVVISDHRDSLLSISEVLRSESPWRYKYLGFRDTDDMVYTEQKGTRDHRLMT